MAENETIKPHDVRVPGILIDYIVEDPAQWQTTQTPYDPAISGEVFKPIGSFGLMAFGTGKAIARRVAQEIRPGWAVNLGFGVSANVPHLHRGGLPRQGDLGDRAGRGGRGAAARLPVRLLVECRGLRALGLSVHLFPGRRLRLFAPLVPADRQHGSVNVSSLACARM